LNEIQQQIKDLKQTNDEFVNENNNEKQKQLLKKVNQQLQKTLIHNVITNTTLTVEDGSVDLRKLVPQYGNIGGTIEQPLITKIKHLLWNDIEIEWNLQNGISASSKMIIQYKTENNNELKECISIATTAAIGGRKLVEDKKIILRFLSNKKYATINNKVNVTLFSIIGHVIMPELARLNKKFAIKFKEVLGGDFLYGNCNLSKLSEKRREALINLKSKHPLKEEEIVLIQKAIMIEG